MIFAALLLAAVPAPAVDTVCAIAEPWTSWTQSGQAKAGTQMRGAPVLILGKPVTAILTPANYVQFASAPGKGAKEGYGGLFALSVKTGARIGVALDSPAWVDVVTGTKAQASVEHGHGEPCSGIRKIVWFDLPAGRHVLQVAGSKSETIRLMAADKLANQPVR